MEKRLLHSFLAPFAILLALALAPEASRAQIVFDNFDDGEVSNTGAFAGGADNTGAGTGPTTGITGAEATGLNLGVDPGSGGGFAGAFVTAPGGIFDASGQTYFSFYIRPSLNADNLPMLLEINLQEDANGDGAYNGATEDEYQVLYRLNGDATYQFVQIPLASFTDDNSVNPGSDDGFDFSKVFNVVFAMGNLQGSPFAISFDEFGFTSGGPVSVASETLPEAFAAAPVAFPNPASGAATLAFSLATPSDVTVDVVDLLGRRVATLASGPQAAGLTRLAVPTADLAPGVYLVRVQTQSGVASTRLSVVR